VIEGRTPMTPTWRPEARRPLGKRKAAAALGERTLDAVLCVAAAGSISVPEVRQGTSIHPIPSRGVTQTSRAVGLVRTKTRNGCYR